MPTSGSRPIRPNAGTSRARSETRMRSQASKDSSAASSVSLSRTRTVNGALSGLSFSGSFMVTTACASAPRDASTIST